MTKTTSGITEERLVSMEKCVAKGWTISVAEESDLIAALRRVRTLAESWKHRDDASGLLIIKAVENQP